MPFPVPHKLKYEEKFVMFSVKQWIRIAVGAVFGFFAWKVLPPIFGEGIGILLFIAGFFFASAPDVEHILKRAVNFYFLETNKGGKPGSNFSPVREISGNEIKMQDGSLASILVVNPQDISTLTDEELYSLIERYARMLNTIDGQMQILMRTSTVNLDHYFENAKSRAGKTGSKKAVEYVSDLKNYVNAYLEKNDVHDRKFYVVIKATAREPGQNQRLEQRVKLFLEGIGTLGLSARLLADEEIKNLLKSFYAGGRIQIREPSYESTPRVEPPPAEEKGNKIMFGAVDLPNPKTVWGQK